MKQFSAKFGILAIMILVAAISRLLPHPYNFTPLVAMALFGGAQFDKKWQAYLMPLAAYLISDIIMQAMGKQGFYGITQLFVYGGMLLVAALGTTLHQPKTIKILGYTLSGSAIFWIVSNFGVWVAAHVNGTVEHEPSLTLGMTYLRALPFYNEFSTPLFLGAFGGDLFYSAVLFGVYALLQKNYQALRLAKA